MASDVDVAVDVDVVAAVVVDDVVVVIVVTVVVLVVVDVGVVVDVSSNDNDNSTSSIEVATAADRCVSKAKALDMARCHIQALERECAALDGERNELRDDMDRLFLTFRHLRSPFPPT
ncbi:hypothetical protein F4780DRAFT_779153 [Xylariomycetidae sp. FL0641]|nr:hypothetical protein F4780DRAFT_779153 [Xylariomycetidae sp. FL0641]